jgi:hypothetical protein
MFVSSNNVEKRTDLLVLFPIFLLTNTRRLGSGEAAQGHALEMEYADRAVVIRYAQSCRNVPV